MLEHVSVVLKHSFRVKCYKSIMNNRSVELRKILISVFFFFFFFSFSTDDISRMVWARPGIIKLILLFSQVVIKYISELK